MESNEQNQMLTSIQYERTIGLKTVGLTFLRRFLDIIVVFVPIALGTVIVTQKVMKPTYSSSITISNNAAISQANYNVMSSSLKNSKLSYKEKVKVEEEETEVEHFVYTEAATKLAEEGIKNVGGVAFTAEALSSSISMGAYASNMTNLTFTMSSKDKTLPKKVLDITMPYVNNAYKKNISNMTNLKVGTAKEASKSSSEDKYLLIGLAAGFVLACGFAFIDEIVSDEVYDEKDVANLGCPGFMIKASK